MIVKVKTLLISHNSLSIHSNNGKTLTSMFYDWPSENLAQLYFQDEIPESISFTKFFRIRDLDIIKSFLLFGRPSVCGSVMKAQVKVVSHYMGLGSFKAWIVDILRRTNTFKLLVRDVIYGTGLWRSNTLIKWIDEFSPDSIFFVGGDSIFSFKLSTKIASIFNIPYDIFITDDYVMNAVPRGFISRIRHKKLLNIYRQSFRFARHVFVIGDDMADVFGLEFGRDFVPIMNSVKMPISFPRLNFDLKKPGKVDVVYAGGLHLGRDVSLVNFANLIKFLSDEVGLHVKLTVYSLQAPDSEVAARFLESGIFYGGPLGSEDISRRLEDADFLLHVESFDEKYISMTKLSVSTKIPEYLAAGACLIAFGPSSLASMRLIERNGIGIALSECDSPEEMKEKLRVVFVSPECRRQISTAGFNFAKSRFDACLVRGKFLTLLNE